MNPLPAIAQFIPFTQSRAKRLLHKSLAKRSKRGDVMVWLEFPDGDVRFKRASWNKEYMCWELESGQMFFSRGKGGDPKVVGGVPFIQCHTEDAGVISTEAALTSGAMEEGQVMPVDERGQPLAGHGGSQQGAGDQSDPLDFELDLDAGATDAGDGTAEAAADGGQIPVADYVPLYEGVEFSLSDATYYDPYPVREEDARQAAEWSEMAGRDDKNFFKYVIYGAVGAFLIVVGLLGFIWLLGEIGGDGGTGVTLTTAASLLLAGPSAGRVRDWLGGVFGGER